MEYVLVVLAVWGIWTLPAVPSWRDRNGPGRLLPLRSRRCWAGLGRPLHLWYGIGWGAAAMFLMLVADVLLVAADCD